MSINFVPILPNNDANNNIIYILHFTEDHNDIREILLRESAPELVEIPLHNEGYINVNNINIKPYISDIVRIIQRFNNDIYIEHDINIHSLENIQNGNFYEAYHPTESLHDILTVTESCVHDPYNSSVCNLDGFTPGTTVRTATEASCREGCIYTPYKGIDIHKQYYFFYEIIGTNFTTGEVFDNIIDDNEGFFTNLNQTREFNAINERGDSDIQDIINIATESITGIRAIEWGNTNGEEDRDREFIAISGRLVLNIIDGVNISATLIDRYNELKEEIIMNEHEIPNSVIDIIELAESAEMNDAQTLGGAILYILDRDNESANERSFRRIYVLDTESVSDETITLPTLSAAASSASSDLSLSSTASTPVLQLPPQSSSGSEGEYSLIGGSRGLHYSLHPENSNISTRRNRSKKNRSKKNRSKKNRSKKNRSKKNRSKKNRSKKNRSKKNRSKKNK